MATKASARLPRVELLHVSTPTGLSGRLSKASQHSFTYDTRALAQADRGCEISLTMPHCLVDRPERVVDRTLDIVRSYVPDNDDSGIWGRIRERAMNGARMHAS